MNVVDVIVKDDYCIGCGVCAGICPSNNLHMEWSDKGELIPYHNDLCKTNCTLCLDVCPFYNHEINQDDIANELFSNNPKIKYNEYTGYYLNCYVGFQKDTEKRLKSASGGLATFFLASLLENKIVDKVVAVGAFEDNQRMFDFKILSNPEEIFNCAGSAYYPVEISIILKKLLKEKEDETYAIISLPCVAYALRLAIKKIPKLKRKIRIITSLTCGQLQNSFCTELIALESGVSVEKLSKMDFRRKSKNEPASNYLQVAIDTDGNEGTALMNNQLPFHLWYYHYFKQNSCNFCDDVFGELADVTFMDAWLPEYVNNYKGTSLIIARTKLAQSLLESSDELYLNQIGVEEVLKSQWGVIKNKRILLKGRLYKKELSNYWYPKKRVNPDMFVYNKNRDFIELTDKIQTLSKKLWHKYRFNESTMRFWEECDNESKIKKYKNKLRLKNMLKIPLNYLKRFY